MADEKSVFELADVQTPWCILTAATLRIPDHIEAGVTEAGELARVTGCDPFALRALLRFLVGRGIFTEEPKDHFLLNGAARTLSQLPAFLDLDGIGGRLAGVWSTLPQYVRTGRPGYAGLFGRPFWADLAAHPELAAGFDELMGPAGHGDPETDLEITGGWEPVRHVVDVGGGTGAMLAGLLAPRPWLRGTLVDQPGTVSRAAPVLAAAGVADRVTVAGQSFFDPLPAGADVYLLKKVINDWPADETAALLRRCAEAAAPDGRVLVVGGVVPDDEPPPLTIEMLLLGATTSTLSEFGPLAARAGLEVVRAGPQAAGFGVECRVR